MGADANSTYTPQAGGAARIFSKMVLGFLTEDGEFKEICFTQRPLGLDFPLKAPIIIHTVTSGSNAEELGAKSGWTLKSINGENVADRDFSYQYEKFKATTYRLLDGSEPQEALMGA
eukprot:gnl/TRDRNA2_/TRDRNA2_172870_c1_seq2.p1 gnl/TRDRNA2_/TRDRNA2_172870_c1~~gnl/TRDRNA2_/TRDRNA2_172870_c1_seq2.p1  ORF type:complete len:131 (+),score=20.80 gnl/TRDRNA2_/TRDRNA2_172870_c1_seq2:45-395(+)